MGWVKLDDGFYDHPKARAVGKDGRELYGASLCHAARYETNGEVFLTDLPLLAAKAEVDVETVVPLLLSAGLWHQGTHICPKCPQPTKPDSYVIHKYLERNPTAAEAEARRERLSKIRAAAGRKGGLSKAGKRPSNLPSKPLAHNGKPRPTHVVSSETPSPASQGDDGVTHDTSLPPEQVQQNVAAIRSLRGGLRGVAS